MRTIITKKHETPLHKALVQDLLNHFVKTKSYKIRGVDADGQTSPGIVNNSNKVGDGENKIPDIEAEDLRTTAIVRGEAKTGDGDLTTSHSITQFQLFGDMQRNGIKSLLYIIVPKSKYNSLLTVLQQLGLHNRPNIIAIASGNII